MFSNIDLGIGTQKRYAERLMGALFTSKSRLMLMGSANNVNDVGFGGGPRGGFGQNRQGLNATKMVGLNYNYEDKGKLKFDASVRWNHSDGDVYSKSSSQNFMASIGSFSNSLSQKYTRTNSWDFRGRLEWTPDSMTNIMFRPSVQLSKSDGTTVSMSATFNEDPYEYTETPLEQEALEKMSLAGIVVNAQETKGITYGDNQSVRTMLQLNRKLNNKGRNITLRGDFNYKNAESTSFSAQDVRLFLAGESYQTNRYNLMPTKNWSYSLQTTYSEPIARKT
jgi:hypothetical protein